MPIKIFIHGAGKRPAKIIKAAINVAPHSQIEKEIIDLDPEISMLLGEGYHIYGLIENAKGIFCFDKEGRLMSKMVINPSHKIAAEEYIRNNIQINRDLIIHISPRVSDRDFRKEYDNVVNI